MAFLYVVLTFLCVWIEQLKIVAQIGPHFKAL